MIYVVLKSRAMSGKALVVYGHTPVPEAEWFNNTICIDTGCVFGGKLTALKYPERELVAVPAQRVHFEPVRPLERPASPAVRTAQQEHDDILDLEDVQGKRLVTTRLRRAVTIREANASAALEVMSRFAANPKWLVYLPPTMSPPETSKKPGLLEHPTNCLLLLTRGFDVAAVRKVRPHFALRAGGAGENLRAGRIDHLRVDMRVRAVHRQSHRLQLRDFRPRRLRPPQPRLVPVTHLAPTSSSFP